MATTTVTDSTIVVHGRDSLVIHYKVKDNTGAQVDISAWTIYFEVDGIPIRELLVSDSTDALGKKIVLERTQVALLSKTAKRFTVVDETDIASDLPHVLWEGTIARGGYVGAPDATDDA